MPHAKELYANEKYYMTKKTIGITMAKKNGVLDEAPLSSDPNISGVGFSVDSGTELEVELDSELELGLAMVANVLGISMVIGPVVASDAVEVLLVVVSVASSVLASVAEGVHHTVWVGVHQTVVDSFSVIGLVGCDTTSVVLVSDFLVVEASVVFASVEVGSTLVLVVFLVDEVDRLLECEVVLEVVLVLVMVPVLETVLVVAEEALELGLEVAE